MELDTIDEEKIEQEADDIIEDEPEDTEEKSKESTNIIGMRSNIVLSLKNTMPKPCNGSILAKRIKKLGLTISDFAFLLNRSVGGFYNLCCPTHARYKKGKKNEDIMLEIAVSYLEKIFEEKKQKAKIQRNKEKERLLTTLNSQEVVTTTLSLRDCGCVENKSKIMSAINQLAKSGINKISYKQVAEITGLTPQQIARIREQDTDIDEWFTYTNEVEFDEMQNKLSKIVETNEEDRPTVAIKAMETKMKFMKSNQKDKVSDGQNGSKNIWNRLKDMKDVTSCCEIVVSENDE